MKFFTGIIFLVLIALTKCNDFKIESRIVGGNTTNIASSPYQVSVRVNDQHICGGAILNPTTIITASHCTEKFTAALMSIRIGATIADKGIKHEITKIIQHPEYDGATVENDVCLLKITPAIKYTKLSQPIKLSTKRLPDGSNVKITGWGRLSQNSWSSKLGNQPLRYAIVNVVNQSECTKDYGSIGMGIDNRKMCAAAKGKDSCQGDSGGPLVSGTGESSELIGICSVGFGCANENFAGVYTLVPSFMEFIKKNM